jgi:hypothetical protein
MDPIHPITPGPLPVSGLPVQPLERITRERDRPSKDSQQRRRRTLKGTGEPPPAVDPGEDDQDERPRIDVRA